MKSFELVYYVMRSWQFQQEGVPLKQADQVAIRVMIDQSFEERKKAMEYLISSVCGKDSFLDYAECKLGVYLPRQMRLQL